MEQQLTDLQTGHHLGVSKENPRQGERESVDARKDSRGHKPCAIASSANLDLRRGRKRGDSAPVIPGGGGTQKHAAPPEAGATHDRGHSGERAAVG